MPVALSASGHVDFFPHHEAIAAEHTNVHFAARAPPMAVTDVAITGDVTVMHGGAFAVQGYETHVASLGFGVCFDATNRTLDGWKPPAGYTKNADGTVTSTDGRVYTPLKDADGNIRTNSNGDPIFNTQSGGSTAQTTLTNPSTSGPSAVTPAPNRTGQFTKTYQDGTFSVSDWKGYPNGVLRPPEGTTYRLLTGTEYNDARKLANNTNRKLRKEWNVPADHQIHEIVPVKYGGSPTDPANKIVIPKSLHEKQVTPWWNKLQRDLGG